MKKIVLAVVLLFANSVSVAQDPVESFIGTWFVSYSYFSRSYTDKLVFDEFFIDDDGYHNVRGNYFPDITGNSQPIYCTDGGHRISANEPKLFCMTISTETFDSESFQFDFSGGVITRGFYAFGTGTTAAEIIDSLRVKSTSVTGNRYVAPSYSDDNELLIIPSLNYRGSFWKVKLKLEQNGGFSINFAEPTNTVSDIVFNGDVLSRLTIPSVIYNRQDYRVVLVFTEDKAFRVYRVNLN